MAPSLASLLAFAASVSGGGAVELYNLAGEFSFGPMGVDAPEWCKNDTALTWKQRLERLEQHATLEWSKKAANRLIEKNETVPEWMDKLVSDDEKRGKTKWVAEEVKRLRAEGKEVPQWMADLEAEDLRWANRWAACKSAELREAGDDVPAWMVENARKGIMDAAQEKAKELQEQIDELEEEKEEETALVSADGDVTLASQKLLARSRKVSSMTLSQQTHVLEVDLEELDMAEGQLLPDSTESGGAKKVKQALWKARAASSLLRDILESKSSLLKTGAA